MSFLALASKTQSASYGSKYTCYVCSVKFYDFDKPEAICPKCETDQRNKPVGAASIRSNVKGRVSKTRKMHSIVIPEEDLLTFAQDFPGQSVSVGEGGAKAQKMGVLHEVRVGDILDKGGAVFEEQYPLKDVKSYGNKNFKIDQLVQLGWHTEDRPVDNNPLFGTPVSCLLETKGQIASGSTDEKLDHAVRRIATCCNQYKVPKGRIVIAGYRIKDDFIRYLNEEVVPDARSCDGLDIEIIRIDELWRRMHHKLPL